LVPEARATGGRTLKKKNFAKPNFLGLCFLCFLLFKPLRLFPSLLPSVEVPTGLPAVGRRVLVRDRILKTFFSSVKRLQAANKDSAQ
jgi:hypothetical protein